MVRMKFLPVLFGVLAVAVLGAEPLSPPVLERYEKMLQAAPEPGTPFDKVYQHYLETEGLDALAQRWKEKAVADDRAAWLVALGLLEDRRGRSDQALAVLREAAGLAADWRAAAALAAVEARMGQLPAAAASYSQALAASPPNDARAALYRGLALSLQRAMDHDGALQAWQDYAQAFPEDPFVLEEAAEALMEAGRLAEARTMLEKLRAGTANDPARAVSAALLLAEVECLSGRKTDALKIYREVLAEVAVASWLQREIRARIENLFRRDDDLPGLVEFYQARLKEVPGDLEAALALASVLEELGRTKDAMAVLAEVTAKAPDRKDVALRLAGLYLQAERTEDAEKVLTALALRFPQDPAILTRQGEAQWQAFKLGKGTAEAALATWRQLAPEGADANAVQTLADLLRGRGLSDEAVREYERALQLEPDAADRRERLVDYLVTLDRTAEAENVLAGIVEGDRANGENYLRLAKIQKRLGQSAAARQSLASAQAFPERAFDRAYLEWQLASEAADWSAAVPLAEAMRGRAATEPERERADAALVESLVQSQAAAARIQTMLDGGPEALAEADWRLVFLLANATKDRGTELYAVQEGGKRFPQSAGLAKLELAAAGQAGDVPRRLAALERLENLEPQRTAEWMADRVRLLRQESRWKEAEVLAGQIITLSPARPEGYLLLAETYQAQDNLPKTLDALRQAVRVSDSPNTIRFRLADIYAAQGEWGQARAILEEAFEAEEKPAGKLALTGRLASVALQEGKIDELIAKFRARQKSEAEGGWRYALYLAEIFASLQDSVRVQEELDRALAGKPEDPVLLKRLKALADTNGDALAAVRYAQKILDVEPSAASRAQWGEALAQAGRTDEALAAMRDNARELFEDPLAWQDAIRAVQAAGRGAELAEMLENSLRAKPDDWRLKLTLAETLMGLGEEERAGKLLWEILDQPLEAAPLPAAAPTPPPAPPGGRFVASWGMRSGVGVPSRGGRFYEVFQRASQILSRDRTGSGTVRFRRPFASAAVPGAVGTDPARAQLQAKDDAMIYLAFLAVRQGREEEYLEMLGRKLADLPLADRLEIYGMLQAPLATVAEIRTAVQEKALAPTDAQIAVNALHGLVANQRNRGSELLDAGELDALVDTLLALQPEAATLPMRHQRYALLMALGRTDAAEALAGEILRQIDPNDPSEVSIGISLALASRDFDRAVELWEKSRTARASGSFPQTGLTYSLALQLAGSEKHRTLALDLLLDEITNSTQIMRFAGMAGGMRQNVQWPQLRGRGAGMLVPYPTKALDAARANLVRGITQGNPALKAAFTELGARAAKRAESSRSALLAEVAIWLQWFVDQKKEAMAALTALVAAEPSDERLMNLALMQSESGDSAGALRTLSGINAVTGDTAALAARLRLALAVQGSDENAKIAAARSLAGFRLDGYEQNELVEEMGRLGLKEEAGKLRQKTTSTRSSGGRPRPVADVMRERMEKGGPAEAVEVAEAILSRDPLAGSGRNERYQFEQALRALQKHKQLDAYVDRLKKDLEQTPESPRLQALLAMALLVREPKDAEPHLRKLVELRPKDPQALQDLGNLLVRTEQFTAAMDFYDRLMAEDPMLLFSQGTNFLEPYRRTNSWSRFSEALRKAPDPKGDPLQPQRQNFGHIFVQIGREMQRARPPTDPTDVWLKGLKWDESSSMELRPMVVQSLLRADRKDEAHEVITGAFFPPGVEASTARVFVFNRQFRANSVWSQWQTQNDGEVENLALRLMRVAQDEGFLDDLQPRFDRLGTMPDGLNPGLLARLVRRDESVLPDLRKLIDPDRKPPPGQPNVTNPVVLRVFASELAGWAAGHKLALDFLDAAARNMQATGPDYGGLVNLYLQSATLAETLGQTGRERQALRKWIAARKDWQQQGASQDIPMALTVLRRLFALDMVREAGEVIEAIKADRSFAQSDDYRRQLRDIENEIALAAGREFAVVPAVAWTPGADGRGTLTWDIRPAEILRSDDRTVWMGSQPLRKLDGRYTVDLFFGPGESAMTRLATKAAAPARGSWEGKLPAGRGVVRAVLRKGDQMAFGPAVPVVSGRILASPAALAEIPRAADGKAPGWSAPPTAAATLGKGGPGGVGMFVHLSGERNVESELVGERVAIDPKKTYQIFAWFRYPQKGNRAQVGWRLLDARGAEVSRYSANGNFYADRWNLAVQGFGRGPNSYSLSDKVAFLEPYLEVRGECDFQGFTIVESDPVRDEDR
jgi:tetratricopeptide (TPR) repeat protein